MADTSTQSSSTPEASASGEFEILRLSSKDEGEKIEYVTLFEIDDVPYEVPKNPSPTVGLRFLHTLKNEGQQAAAYYMLTTMLSEDGYKALMEYDKLTQEQYDFVLAAAVRIATGRTERPKARTRQQPGTSGRRK